MNLYHYCSNSAFVSIISTREIWASDFSLSNDLLEGKWVREIFKEFCREKNIHDFEQAKLLGDLAGVAGLVSGVGFCMSEEGDLLSQWRAYAEDGAGVSIGFSKEYFEALGKMKMARNDSFNAVITKVTYDLAKQREMLSQQGEEIVQLVLEGGLRTPSLLTPETDEDEKQRLKRRRQIMLGLFLVVFQHFCSFKNPAFAEEKEWRLISHVLRGTAEHPLGDLRNMEFRSLPDRIVPFRRIPLDEVGIAPITDVVLGPKHVTPEEIVDAMFKKHSMAGAIVRRSGASYR